MANVGEVARVLQDNGSFVGSIAAPVLRSVPAGHTILLAVNTNANSAITSYSATDSKGNTWSQRAFQLCSIANNGQLAVLSCKVTTALTTSDTITVTANTRTPATWMILAEEFDDLVSFDVQVSATGTSSSPSSGATANGAQNSELVFGAFAVTSNPAFTPGSGCTSPTGGPVNATTAARETAVQWQYVNAAGSRSAAAGLGGTQVWAAAAVVFTVANNNPTAAFTHAETALTSSFDSSGSTAVSPATIASRSWDFGDGNTGTGTSPSHTYAAAGSYIVTLTVTDSNGLTDQVSHQVTVNAPAATVTAQSVDSAVGWTPSTGTALACITDGDATTYVASAAPPTGQEFDVTLQALTPPAVGQPLKVFLTADAILASSGHVDAQLFEGTTQRSAVSGVAVPSGSGSTVTGTVTLTFPWSDVSAVTNWNALKLKLQATAS